MQTCKYASIRGQLIPWVMPREQTKDCMLNIMMCLILSPVYTTVSSQTINQT